MESKNTCPLSPGMSNLFVQAQQTQKELAQEYQKGSAGAKTSPDKLHKATSKPRAKPSRPAPTSKGAQKPKAPPTTSNNNITKEKEEKEFFDSEEVLQEKLDTLSQWVKNSGHVITFTGAGISTSTGIPDFRSGMNTVLPTGPGVWELRAKGVAVPKRGRALASTLKAVPSKAHMAIVKLHEQGLVKFTVSQNVDGLHRRSGLHPDQLSELHGNTNLEKCLKCGAKYMRDFRTRTARAVHDHKTGRLCDNLKCQGPLEDSIINFNEDLPDDELEKAFDHGRRADLCIVLGSSLRVFPAADIPEEMIQRGARVVICNLQKTPMNKHCAMEIHATTDTIMCGLMERLGLEIPSFHLKRRFALEISPSAVTLQGLDLAKDIPYSFLKGTYLGVPKELGTSTMLTREPFTVKFRQKIAPSPETPLVLEVTLAFQGHYGEPEFSFKHKVTDFQRVVYTLEYDLAKQQWHLYKH